MLDHRECLDASAHATSSPVGTTHYFLLAFVLFLSSFYQLPAVAQSYFLSPSVLLIQAIEPNPPSSREVEGEKAQIDLGLLINYNSLNEEERGTVLGFWIVVGTFLIVVLGIPVLQLGESTIAVYRPYEERLLKLSRLDLEDLLNYHSQFKWGDYSGIAIGMVLLSITLIIINSTQIGSVNLTIQSVVVGVMAIAVVFLVFADLTHTNTQTPIIPVKRRFKLIDLSVQLGTTGTLLLIFAVLLFTSMVGISVVVVSCSVFLGTMVYANYVRRIPKTQFFRYFGIVDEENWVNGGGASDLSQDSGGTFQKDRHYIQKWQTEGRGAFYQKLGKNRPLSVYVEDWIQKIEATGLINAGLAYKLRESIPNQRKIARKGQLDEQAFLRSTLAEQLRKYMVSDLATEQEVKLLIESFSDHFGWTSDEIQKLRSSLDR